MTLIKFKLSKVKKKRAREKANNKEGKSTAFVFIMQPVSGEVGSKNCLWNQAQKSEVV